MTHPFGLEDVPNPITVRLEQQKVLTRWPCEICGGSTDKAPIAAVFGDHFFVCASCVKAGPDEFPRLLHEQADNTYRRAAALEALAEIPWIVPSYQEYEDANMAWDSL
jgi:hypothetical protein